MPPEFVAVSGDWLTSLLLLHADVCVNVVVKFLCGVPLSVHVFVDAPCAAGAASAAIANAAGMTTRILLVTETPPCRGPLPGRRGQEAPFLPAPAQLFRSRSG